MMEIPGELQFHSCVRGYHVYKDGDLQYKMDYSLANAKRNAHELMQLLQLAITSSTYLFAALIAVDGTWCDSGPSACGDNTDALKYLKNLAESWHQLLVLHVVLQLIKIFVVNNFITLLSLQKL